MMEGAQMMIVDYHPTTYETVQSYAHYLSIPTLVPGGTGSNASNRYKYDISLLPPTIDAIVSVVKHFQWNTVVYYIFDTNDGRFKTTSEKNKVRRICKMCCLPFNISKIFSVKLCFFI